MKFTNKKSNFHNQFFKETILKRLEIVDKMNFTEKEIDLIDEKHDDFIDKYEQDLTPIELHYLHNEDNELNTCNNCNIIKNTWDTDEFKLDCDHDLKGHTALCNECYVKLECKAYE